MGVTMSEKTEKPANEGRQEKDQEEDGEGQEEEEDGQEDEGQEDEAQEDETQERLVRVRKLGIWEAGQGTWYVEHGRCKVGIR